MIQASLKHGNAGGEQRQMLSWKLKGLFRNLQVMPRDYLHPIPRGYWVLLLLIVDRMVMRGHTRCVKAVILRGKASLQVLSDSNGGGAC